MFKLKSYDFKSKICLISDRNCMNSRDFELFLIFEIVKDFVGF